MSDRDDKTAPETPVTPFRDRLGGWALGVSLGALRHMPGVAAYAVGDLLAMLLFVGSWFRERRVGRGVHRNLRIVYRERLSRAGRRRWAWARHMTEMVVDFARMPRINESNLDQYVDLSDLNKLRSKVNPKQGLICITGHIGVPELTGHVAGLSGLQVTGVFRPNNNRPVDRLLTKIRSCGGQKVLSKWVSVWPLKKALDRGEMIGLAADENTDHKPVFVPFLGTMAATTAMPAMLQLATGLPMAVISVHRVERARYRFHLWDIVRHTATGDRRADVQAILTKMNAALSRSILAYPEQWFWGARRFRERPPGEAPGPDGLPPPCHDGVSGDGPVQARTPQAREA